MINFAQDMKKAFQHTPDSLIPKACLSAVRCFQRRWEKGRRLLAVICLPAFAGTAAAQSELVNRQDTLDEVVITSQSTNRRVNDVQIGAEKVDVEIMSRLPALLGERDIIKGLQLLPGVKSEAEGLGGYQVRGGTSSQNHILLDGAAVYNVGHLMGLFSSFNDDAMGSVELFKGLMPARYGGGSSSVLNIGTRTGDNVRHHLSMNVGLLSTKAEVDGPLGHKGASYLVAARTSYLDIFIKPLPKYRDNTLRFYDFNARMNFRLGENDQLYFSFFRGYDMIEVEKMLNMDWSNTAGSLGWLHTKGTRHHALTQLVASNYGTAQGMDVYSFNLSMHGYNRQLTLRHQQTWVPDTHHTINAGGETTLIGLQSAEWRVTTNHEREKRDGWLSALWASDDMSLFNKHLQLSASLRMEWLSALGGKPYYELDADGNITGTTHPKKGSVVKTYALLQPRASITWKIGQTAALKAGYSRMVQSVQALRNSSMTMPFDRLTIISNNIKPQIADQVAAGCSMMTKDGGWDFSADTYWKTMSNVYDYRDGKIFNSDIEIERLIIGGKGRAYGLELAVHKNKGRTTGWVAYTLSWVQNKIEGVMDGQWYTAPNDRRHDLVMVVMSQLNSHWELSTSWRYTTGQAMTAPSGKYEISGETYYYFGDRNKSRAPDYHRLDLSLAYSVKKKKATHTWTFGIYNAYNRYNPFFVSFEEDDSHPKGTKATVTSLFGFIPTVSFSFKY